MAMFYGTGSQLNPNETEIILPDIEPEPFKIMLKYLYSDELCVVKKISFFIIIILVINFLFKGIRFSNEYTLYI